jgi:uncharacterized membrane protein
MKHSVLALFLALILAASALPAQAAEISQYQITFDIQPSGEVKESIHVAFSQPVEETYFSYMFTGDILDLEINNTQKELEYSIQGSGQENMVRLLVPAGTRELFIAFSSRDLVFWNGNIMQFFTNFRPPAGLPSTDIMVILPQGFSIYRGLASPEGSSMSTDGSRIALVWSLENPGEDVPISVKMYNPYQDADFLLIPAIALASGGGVLWLFLRYRRKSEQAFLKGFTEDESKVVQLLRQRKCCYQNRLVKELGFSKAKMSRITHRLEKRGLIQKEKSGKNKRIEWKG